MLVQEISKEALKERKIEECIKQTVDNFLVRKLKDKGINFFSEENSIVINHKRYCFCEKALPLIFSELEDKEERKLISNLFMLRKNYSEVKKVLNQSVEDMLLPKNIKVIEVLKLRKKFYVLEMKERFKLKEVSKKREYLFILKDFFDLEEVLERDLRERIS